MENVNNINRMDLFCADKPLSFYDRKGKYSAAYIALILGMNLAYAVPAAAETSQTETSTESSSTELAPISVVGEGDTIATPYAGGQVSNGGRVGMLGNKDFMDTPFNTISYTDSFITDRQAQDITDVIAATDPSVFYGGVTGDSRESYSIRGFRSDIGDVTFDGMFGVAPYFRSSPEMFERIEVLKGPSALLNGMPPNGSVGGSVNLVPKRAGGEPNASITTTYISDSQFGGHVDLGRRFGANQQFGIRFNGAYRDGETSVNDQDKEVQLGSLALDWRGERARISADLYASEDSIDGATRGVTLAPGVSLPKPPDSDTLLNPDWGFNHAKDKGALIRGEYDLNDRNTVYAAFGTSETEFESTNSSVAQIINEQGDFRHNAGDTSDKADRDSVEVGIHSRFKTGAIGHEVAINAKRYEEDYRLNARRGVLYSDWITNIYDPEWAPRDTPHSVQPITKTELELTSVGIADTISFAQDKVQLTLGVRRQEVVQDSYMASTGARLSSYEESAVTPAVAGVWRLTDDLSLYANYIEGLSQGDTAPTTAENAGEIFEPYKTKQTELGLKLDLGDFAHTVSVYQIKRPSSYTDPLTNVFSSGGEQRNRGIEWSFFGTPFDNIRLMGGIAYVDAELTKTQGGVNQGNQASGVPEFIGKLGAEWDTPMITGLTLTGNATSVSEQYIDADNEISLPGHTIFDVGARYETRLADQSVTWRLNVKNLTDKAYWAMPHYSSLGLGAPRTVMLSATMDF
ncbi:TonB-dependent receptor [Marinobacterium mangrovicola]|uniref:Iron complex outermembrane receptor protein n=1 Tax=Marinobacterium mangrovicola TaxID=1476959 RepID=A0A4V2PEI6_9GAMM|nr:TonB-dependent siderophore receptor [Marinobacterium mangrovicola]TCK09276.1 iron complex outermembrane receptor protein [Marinobacterium mangrovicola]